MKKSEEEALKAFPPRMEFPSMVSGATGNKVDTNEIFRKIFIKGYEQAMKDLLEDYGDYVVSDDGEGFYICPKIYVRGAWKGDKITVKAICINKRNEQEPHEIQDNLSDDTLRQAVVDEVVKYSGENYWNAPWIVDSTGIAHPLHFAQLGARWQREHVWRDPEEDPDIDRYVSDILLQRKGDI